MANHNKSHTITRILEILGQRNSPLASEIKKDADLSVLSRTIRTAIVDELSMELTEKGLDANDEATAYGEEIEHLIDSCKLHRDERD